ncbi:SDR family NAD(P)-dependent oxidoreductase [Commensalibacter oyaizuii]|uniref:SDR family NAD(P)-dependent oxidoreductase n=1 Tax=Commensalibacter oyaizuii TaxID=3043873 RepID=A0ABT6Q2K7_9PROT|nr:SDR family NAD(P)-dependent oxidoreductase [Commensalibacter sp. TBRC 16381]MDI2091351.1 SDR family NAD(P)-dependent oxidoreductase [Commensalibacter sp. TBRC 16381]
MRFNIFTRSKKVAVVTGATGGLGKQLVKHLLAKHYKVVMVARNLMQMEQISLHFGKNVTSCICDISQPNEIHYLLQEIRSRFGQIDALIHCAGNIYPGPLDLQSDDMIQKQIQTNLTGAIIVTKELLPLLKRNSSIIFINSLGGLLPLKGSALYSAGKFGLRGFALALSMELRPKRIYVSSIFPGAIDTKMLRQEIKNGGSNLNFCTPPLSADEVCRTVITALRKKKQEYYLPKWSGIQIKLVMLKPALVQLLMPYMERKGKKGKKIWAKRNRNNLQQD